MMAKKLTCIFLNRKKKFSTFLILLCLLCSYNVSGQKLVLRSSTVISDPVAASIDRLNNIYIADKKGNLKQYTNGQLQQIFSPQKSGSITLVEAWNPLKIFLFYADFQEYLFLDRFLTSPQRYSSSEWSRFSGMMTISADNNLWVIDYVDFGLKKYDINFSQFTVTTPFDLILDPENHEISFIREYQNLVFISDKVSGILIFDNMGNYLRKISAKEINYFSFLGDYLYFIQGDELIVSHIYSSEKKVIKLPEPALYALPYEKHIALITENALNIYEFQ